MAKPRVTSAFATVAGRLEPFEHDPLRFAFLVRGIEALTVLAERLDQTELGTVVASSSDAATLVSALTQPSTVGLFSATDPLAPARLRGIQARDTLLAAEGGTLGAEQVGTLLHVSRQAVDKRRLAGKLLAVETGRRGYRYPVWQFVDSGVLPGLEETLALLAEHPPFAKLRFFVSGNVSLGGD